MFGKAISFGGLLFLGGAAVLVTPGFGQAQHHGGGGHGGFHTIGTQEMMREMAAAALKREQ